MASGMVLHMRTELCKNTIVDAHVDSFFNDGIYSVFSLIFQFYRVLFSSQIIMEIKDELEKTGYRFTPHADDLQIISSWECGDLGRALIFMLFDDLDYPFFWGEFSCTKDGFFLERKFFLGLSQNTDPSFIFRILRDERFVGMPPTLHIETASVYPVWNTHFHITLMAGTGFESKEWTVRNAARELLKTTIHDSIALYEESIEGFSSMVEVERFLKLAYRCYEAY